MAFFKTKICVNIFVLSLGLFGSTQAALAAPITFFFGGSVGHVDPLLSSVFNSTQTISGSYTFESMTPNSMGGLTQAEYPDSIIGVNIQIGNFVSSQTFPNNASNGISIEDGGLDPKQPEWGWDYYNMDFDVSPMNLLDGIDRAFFTFQLNQYDLPSNGVTGLDLPLTPPDISLFNISAWHLFFIDLDLDGVPYVAEVQGTMNTLTTSPVPLPAAFWLFGVGILGFLRLVRRERIC